LAEDGAHFTATIKRIQLEPFRAFSFSSTSTNCANTATSLRTLVPAVSDIDLRRARLIGP